MISLIEKGLPLKQGLKLGLRYCIKHIRHIEKGLPLKQGLKLLCICADGLVPLIEKGLPLKQGLKLDNLTITEYAASD